MSSVKILLLRDLDARGKEDSLALDSMPNFQRLVGPPHRYGSENNCCNSGNDLSHTLPHPNPSKKKRYVHIVNHIHLFIAFIFGSVSSLLWKIIFFTH